MSSCSRRPPSAGVFRSAPFVLALSIGLAACTEAQGGAGSGGGEDEGASDTSTVVIVGATTASAATSTGATGAGGAGGQGGATEASSASGGGGATTTHGAGAGGAGEGGGGDGGHAACSDFASDVVEVTYGPGAGFGQDDFPDILFGGPRGAGAMAGSLDVLSLGNGGSITVAFGAQRIVDGEGPDFIVFENAFWAGGDPELTFAELGTVEVSADGETWVAFPCTALEAPFGACAGWRPIYANVDENDIDPRDPAVAGGDAFDLADVGLREARFVRITDRVDQTGLDGLFDLDAVAVVHGSCSAEP